jgi:YfiH family protein
METKLLSKKYKDGEFLVYPDKPSQNLVHCLQTHSNIILEYRGDSLLEIKADGIIICPKRYPEKQIAIKTADCLPVLLIGNKIVLIHAGWKGLENGILQNELLNELNITEIFIGPAIQKYEIQEDFKSNFPKNTHFTETDGKIYFNLQKEAMDQLKTKFPNAKILCSNICTFENKLYNSYRRDKTKIRNWNVFKIN